jgi:hypothetical protein
MGDDVGEVISESGLSQWRIWEELALEQLAARPGLARAPLVPGSDEIQLVTRDGEHLGHVRRDETRGSAGRWVAVAVKQAQPCGRYTSAGAAARGLARACGKDDESPDDTGISHW